MNAVNYPAWQSAIRKAQAEQQRKREVTAHEQAKAQAEQQRKHGYLLHRALAFFDIDAYPETNEFVEDGIRFSLICMSSYDKGDIFREREDSDRVKFKLRVAAMLPDGYENVYDYSEPRYLTFQIVDCQWEHEWTGKQAELADAIDRATAERQRLIEDADRHRARLDIEAARPQPEPELTLAERLEALIREIARQEQDHDAE